jgi:signal transduction histidine kinase/ActR/RegA family two-component response regulator
MQTPFVEIKSLHKISSEITVTPLIMENVEQDHSFATTTSSKPDHPIVIREVGSGGYVRASRTFTEQMGYEATELQNKPLLDWIDPSRHDCFRKILEAGSGSIVASHQTKAGDWIEFEWQIKSWNEKSMALGSLFEDPASSTNSHRAQTAELPSTMHEVLEEMARIIEAERPGLKCSVLLLDDNGRLEGGAGPSLPEEYNNAVEGLIVGPGVGSCGTAAFWGERVIVEDIQKDVLWKDLKEIAARAGVASCWSHPIRSKNGKILGATALYSPTPRIPTQQELDGLGTAASMFGLAIERAYAEQALEKSKAARAQRESELEDQLHQAAKMEALGVLAGGVAHDFNNMLVTVLGNAEIAMATVPKDDETQKMLKDIVTASRSATELCNQMLAYAGRGVMTPQSLECNAMIKELGGLLQVAISKKASLEYDLSDAPLIVEGDKSQLGQVFMNLITNASEALMTETGQVLISTGLSHYDTVDLEAFQIGNAQTAGSYVWLKVSDTGCGMDAETQAKIFDPFFTTKFTGRGLGMAAVRGIVLRHKGHIQITTEPSSGTTFTVLLPSTTPQGLEVNPEEKAAPKSRSKRIMIVDDEPQVRKTLDRLLSMSGFEVVQAKGGREAIDVFRSENQAIDCVLLDLSMPDLAGEETFRELKKIRPDVRVVLNSGYAEQEILDRIKGAGFAGLLHKPTPMNVLLETLQEVTKSV